MFSPTSGGRSLVPLVSVSSVALELVDADVGVVELVDVELVEVVVKEDVSGEVDDVGLEDGPALVPVVVIDGSPLSVGMLVMSSEQPAPAIHASVSTRARDRRDRFKLGIFIARGPQMRPLRYTNRVSGL